ncbi:uncharacterized protein F4812DRAFT_454038 [Daldinia caldariorum]|uniref:uncharacterized protein n=1 Tax=Daldinia caldariorum TaxID=326644 RepID=UPI0020083544|nr:uncharacterized protein F4812DRAFT_454038 [Daldinia caldariorum]KAI1472230.1 hypothetical protein F4812DRAFT_454038 [Daldinia caldariorum]
MGKPTALPKNWPPSLPYLQEPCFAPHVTKAQQQILRTRPRPRDPESGSTETEMGADADIIPRDFPRGPSSLARILPITAPESHPARGQSGLFAARPLPPGTLVLPYYGVVHSSSSPHATAHHHEQQSDYDLWLDRDAGLAVDAARAGNEARFVNDYRGVAARPNCEFRECWDLRRGERCMAVFVLRAGKKNAGNKKAAAGVAKGEELLVSYGKGFWSKRRDELRDHEGVPDDVPDDEAPS